MEGKFYALYVRVSTEEQASSREGSLVSQTQRLKEYLQFQKKDNYIVYQDEGSGKNTNRPEYQRLIADIKAGNVQAVVCTEISRISRSVIDFHQFLKLLKQYGVGFISLREQFDTATAQGDFLAGLFILLAQYEREQISERTSANLRARTRRGLFNGGYLYGYRPRPGQKGYLDIDERQASIVRNIYEQYLELGSYSSVVDWLNMRGYQPRSGEKWCKNSVLTILRNPSYISKKKVGGELLPMVWDPIIDEKIWYRVQDLLDRSHETRRKCPQENEGHIFLFRGILYCAHCKKFLDVGSGTSQRGKTYFYYRHPARSRKPTCPLCYCYSAENIEKFLYYRIMITLDDEELLKSVCGEVSEKLCGDRDVLKKELEFTERELTSIEKEALSLIETMPKLEEREAREFISPRLTSLYEKKKKLESRNFDLKGEILKLEREVILPCEVEEIISFLKEEFLGMDELSKQKILSYLVEKIEIYDGGKMLAYMNMPINSKTFHSHDLIEVRGRSDWYPALNQLRTLAFWIVRLFIVTVVDSYFIAYFCLSYSYMD